MFSLGVQSDFHLPPPFSLLPSLNVACRCPALSENTLLVSVKTESVQCTAATEHFSRRSYDLPALFDGSTASLIIATQPNWIQTW